MADNLQRCAVYTRKSTEDGLEQEFNSLDAQYEACAAYAVSQRHEGWVLNAERYDDGGFSGGNLQRPGLQQLLADVAAGKVDIILVYKIDRLTRSLADFAKIVDVLDKAQASFVSITQSFNTTTSMGRLTLNMLLSFAQFEREVTGERIRDKIAASKRKGLWMGGPVPLGYNVENRRLVVNENEAALVRHIMERYLWKESVQDLANELNAAGHRTKLQVRASGPHRGGCAFRRGTLYHLLSNPIYRGMIVHKGESYPGEHEPIVSKELWDEVQAALKERTSGTSRRLKAKCPSLLTGMLFDGQGRAMTPTHATRSAKRYRYYITRPDQLDGTPAWRVSADDLEKLVCSRLEAMLSDKTPIAALAPDDAQQVSRALAEADLTAASLRSGEAAAKLPVVQALVSRVQLGDDKIVIEVPQAKLCERLGLPSPGLRAAPLVLTCEATKVRRGHQLRLVIPSAEAAPAQPVARDEKLVGLIAEAFAVRELVLANPERSMNSLAAEQGKCRTRMAKLLAISCIEPALVTAIVEGRQLNRLTARGLLVADLPVAWKDQRGVVLARQDRRLSRNSNCQLTLASRANHNHPC